jgi:hypothetical protein
MIAKGAVFHAMYVRNYATEKQWESDAYDKVAKFLLTQDITKQIKPEKPTVALFQPTWASAAIPAMDKDHMFLPAPGPAVYIARMQGLVESFGLPYRLITEDDLLDPKRLRTYAFIILPMSDQMPRVLGPKRAAELLADLRVLAIPLRDAPVKRSEFREMLAKKHIPISFDYDGETCVAGRVNNLIFNWTAKPIKVRTLWKDTWKEAQLGADAYEVQPLTDTHPHESMGAEAGACLEGIRGNGTHKGSNGQRHVGDLQARDQDNGLHRPRRRSDQRSRL